MEESLHQLEVFNYYYGLGKNRSLKTAAEHFPDSLSSLERWSVKFQWQERINKLDKEIKAKMMEKTKTDMVDFHLRCTIIIVEYVTFLTNEVYSYYS